MAHLANLTGPTDGGSLVIPGCGDSPPVPATAPHQSVLIMAAAEAFISLIGLLGNAVVIFVLVMARDRQDTSSVTYVLNLAIADFCFLGTVPFKIAQMIASKWIAGEFMCKVTGGLITYLNFLVSPLFLMVMSIDRYLAVNKAVSSAKLRAPKTSRIVSIVVWIIAGCAALPMGILHTTYPEELRCYPRFPDTKPAPLVNADICAFQICRLNYTNSAMSRIAMQAAGNVSVTNISRLEDEAQNGRQKRSFDLTTSSPLTRRNRKKSTPRQNGRHKNRKRSRNLPRTGTEPNIKPVSTSVTGAPDKLYLDRYAIDDNATPGVSGEQLGIGRRDSLELLSDPDGTLTYTLTSTSPDLTLTALPFGRSESAYSPESNSTKAPEGSGGFEDILLREASIACIHHMPPPPAEKRCYHAGHSSSFNIWLVINFFYSYFLPCAIIVVCYAAILRKLYQPSGMLRGQESGARIRRQTMRKKVTLMVATLVISYMVCFTPYYIWQLIKLPGVPVNDWKICSHMERFNELMVYVNSALNPILYTFLSDQFGSKFKLAWRRMIRSATNHIIVVPTREKNKHSFKKDDSPVNQNAPMLSRDSNHSSENNCNAPNNMTTHLGPIVKQNQASQPIKTDQNLNVTIEDGRTVVKIANSTDLPEERQNGDSMERTETIARYADHELQVHEAAKTSPDESNMSLLLGSSQVPDGGAGKRTTQQRHLADEGERVKSSRSKLFPCVCDCESNRGDVCRQCAQEEEIELASASDVFLEHGDVSDDVIHKNATLGSRWRRAISGINVIRRFSSARTNSSSSQKTCKKHKKQNRLSKTSTDLRNNKEEPSMLSVGRWVYSTSGQSDSRFLTEYTAVTTPI